MRLLRTATMFGFLAVLAVAGVLSAQDPKPGSDAPKTKPTAKAKSKSTGAAKSDSAKKSDDSTKSEEPAVKTEKATIGGGCFWCLEAVYERVKGVKNVVSGYSGGTLKRPTYDDVLTGLTGHAEVVQIEYDPEVVTYEQLLNVFWACHDPTSLNAQGPDFGTQYRSIILCNDEQQAAVAQKSMRAASASFPLPIVTEIVPLVRFYPAEKYHQDYFRKNRSAPYCQAQIVPKLAHMKELFGEPEAQEAARKKSATKD
jgi:peptide-methionine (S)-S-oxide reductase